MTHSFLCGELDVIRLTMARAHFNELKYESKKKLTKIKKVVDINVIIWYHILDQRY
jgi:hypothetical protein